MTVSPPSPVGEGSGRRAEPVEVVRSKTTSRALALRSWGSEFRLKIILEKI